MDLRKAWKICELCNCKTETPLVRYYFDFCIGCLYHEWPCKTCNTGPSFPLDQLTKMRLKVEFIILNSEAALMEAEELSVMLRKEAEKEQKDSKVKVKKEKKLSKK